MRLSAQAVTRIPTNAPVLAGSCIVLALGACGGGDAPAAGAAPRPAAAHPASATAAPPLSPVVRDGRLAGRLLVTPRAAKPGDRLQMTVKNVGTITLSYGLAQRVQRRVDGRWRNAAKKIYGTSEPGFRLLAYNVEPGKRGRARADRIALPDDLDPGTYRVLKHVGRAPTNAAPDDPDTDITLKATFVVR